MKGKVVVINWYKRYVFFILRVMGKVPGYRRYSAFLTRCYTKRFWTTTVVLQSIGVASYVGFYRLVQWLATQGEQDLEVETDDVFHGLNDA